MKVVVSWSGGKDSCYAYYLATQQGHKVINLLTMMMSEYQIKLPHDTLRHPRRTSRSHWYSVD